MQIKNGIHDMIFIFYFYIKICYTFKNTQIIQPFYKNQNLSCITLAAITPYLNIQPNIHFAINKNTHAIGKYCAKLHISCPKTDAFFYYAITFGVFNFIVYLNRLFGMFSVSD